MKWFLKIVVFLEMEFAFQGNWDWGISILEDPLKVS